jgi:predicted Ser/Thr protein kinase/tetratricopeptide (TPR) repeat protein
VAVRTDILPPRYRGARRIGVGGMGEIYRTTDETLGRAVAIKLLAERFAADESIRRRFTREALTAARLSGQANTVTIYDVGEWHDRPFIVMEYLGGGSLDAVLSREGAQPPQRVLRWLEQAAAALDHAHANGVVHRDVKPGNLLLDRDRNVHVADFGVASAAGLDSLTLTGTVLGTAGYLSPEQAEGVRATAASDSYALAVVAFELLTDGRPYERESVTAEAAAHVSSPVPSPCDRLPQLPCELDPVFERALAKDPAQRYPTCADFVGALHGAFDEAAGKTQTLAPAPPRRPAAPRPRRSRARWPLLLALLLGIAILGAVIGVALTSGGGERQASTLVRTVTRQGETKTVTSVSPQPSPPPPPAAPPAAVAGTPQQLVDQATGKIRSGDYAGALPLAQQALSQLQGTGQLYEAYANYDVGKALAELGRCDEALSYIDRSEQIQGDRSEFDAVRSKCKK